MTATDPGLLPPPTPRPRPAVRLAEQPKQGWVSTTIGVLFLVAVVGFVVAGIIIGGSGQSGYSTDPKVAVQQWLDGGGGAEASRIAAATSAVAQAGGSMEMRVRCTDVSTVANQANAYGPIPDAEAQSHWANSLGLLHAAGVRCVSALNSGQLGAYQDSGLWFSQATAEMQLAVDRVRTVRAGN